MTPLDLDTRRFPGTPSESKEEAEVRAMDVNSDHILNERELLKNLRKPMVIFLALLSLCWLVSCGDLLLLQGFSRFTGFNLATSAVIALITTTTANVLAMLVVVVKFVFP